MPRKDVFRFIKDALDETEEETRKKVGNKFYTWSEHYNTWIDIIKPILGSASEFQKNNSMIIFRLVEIQNELLWVQTSVLYGRYHAAIRELRYMLDSILQAYYLDRDHPDSDILCKLEILKEIEKEAYGARLIDKLDTVGKQQMKETYALLSKYAHGSYEELKLTIEEGAVDYRVTYAFNKELFERCVELTNQVMDAVYLISLESFPSIMDKISQDVMTIRWMKESRCILTLNRLGLASG